MTHHSKMAFFLAFSASSLFCRESILWMLILATLSTYLASVEVCLSAFLYLFSSSVPQLQVTEELLICPLLLSPAAHGLLLFVGRLFWHFPASAPDLCNRSDNEASLIPTTILSQISSSFNSPKLQSGQGRRKLFITGQAKINYL